jgi:acyl-CoA thioesterase FadM
MEKVNRDGSSPEVVAFGRTEHVLVNDEMKPLRIIPELKKIMETQTWNETLLLNL